MNLIFSEIDSGQIDGLWGRYVKGLDEYLYRWPHQIEWTSSDVRKAVKIKTAQMVNVYEKDKQIGFFVYRKFREEFTGKLYIHLWLGNLSKEFRGRIREILPEFFEYLEKVRKKNGAYYIEFDSPRKGWERIMARFGMKPKRTVYRKEVA